MALTKGTNSYATVAEADSYFENRLDAAAWTDAEDDQKALALMTATALLDDQHWIGAVSDVDQDLAFPRVASYFDPKKGQNITLDEEVVPIRITIATYELAYHLLNNDGILDSTGSVLKIEVGPIKLDKIQTVTKIPGTVKRQINPLLKNGGSRVWWRAN
jgi:hypothetical protein